MFDKQRYGRLKWGCRRGMLELDVLFMPFAESGFLELSEEKQELFERLLTFDDPDLYAWFMGHQPCNDKDINSMIEHILSRVKV
ncbi:MAG: succinate dehydrogenase assembly factor 2 [Paraglaciecola sp.]|uniref:FAD assembly factor SdhE n=1 Tax=Paraglaciecola sp. TaxID=1920173 RepID=UPI0032655122